MINFEYTFERTKDLDDFTDEFQNRFELAMINKNYLIAGYHNFLEATDNAETVLKAYDAFWSYSLCHLKFSYRMFDNKGARPDVSIFAPCTMYMYIRKGTNKIIISIPTLTNWSETLSITDEKLDIEISEILTELGMKPVANVNPLLLIHKKTK